MEGFMKKRTGMTLIELLVVLAIMVILLGILLPAVQKVREASRRSQCAHQVAQIGLACHIYHDNAGSFPPGYMAFPGIDATATSPGWGWASCLLPYLEQEALYRQIIFTRPIEDPLNAARRTLIPIFVCPSDPDVPAAFPITDMAERLIAEAAPISYAACIGSGEPDEAAGPKGGVFYRNSKVRLTDITDGTSTTIMIGDRAWSHAMAPWSGAVNGGIVRAGPLNEQKSSPAATDPSPNFPCVEANWINGAACSDGSIDQFFGQHLGGVNMAFADGGVRFLHQHMSRAVLAALGTRAGGEVVDEADY